MSRGLGIKTKKFIISGKSPKLYRGENGGMYFLRRTKSGKTYKQYI